MKKSIKLTAVVIAMMFMVMILAACGSNTYPQSSPGWAIEELGETIVAAGSFWEEWWSLRGRFASEHLGDWQKVPEHLISYQRLLPSSGFESLDDIRNYLLQYYTETWADKQLSDEWRPILVEYDSALYVDVMRAGITRTNWDTAAHTLLEQDGGRAVVEASALSSAWHMLPNLVWCGDREEFLREAQEQIIRGDTYINTDVSVEIAIGEAWYRITLIDGRIDTVERPDWP